MKGFARNSQRLIVYCAILLMGLSMLLGGVFLLAPNTQNSTQSPSQDSTIQTNEINNNNNNSNSPSYTASYDPNDPSEPYGPSGNTAYRFNDLNEGYVDVPSHQTDFGVNTAPSIHCSVVQLSYPVELVFVSNPNNMDANKQNIVDWFEATPNYFAPPVTAYLRTTVTVKPKKGLIAGNYVAYLRAIGGHKGRQFISSSYDIRFRVTVKGPSFEPGYSIYLRPEYEFESRIHGYSSLPQEFNAVITNTGTEDTGELIIEIGGPNSSSFKFGREGRIQSIPVHGTSSFTVQPIFGLAPGVHIATATVRCSADNSNPIKERTLTVYFSVEHYSISVDPPLTDFGSINSGYTAESVPARTITVKNTGGQPTGTLSLSVLESSNFTLSRYSLASIPKRNDAVTFTVRPNDGLPGGIHIAFIRVGNSLVGWETVKVRFEVTSSHFSFTLTGDPNGGDGGVVGGDPGSGNGNGIEDVIRFDEMGTYIFPARDFGYSPPPTAYTATLKNIGGQATGTLQLKMSGGTNSSFDLSASSVGSIPVASSRTFTVRPKPKLSAGQHMELVTITGTEISYQFAVSFFVRSFGISVPATVTIPTISVYDTEQPPAQEITIKNMGNQPTGELTITLLEISTPHASPISSSTASSEPYSTSSFTVSRTSLDSIEKINGTSTFTIQAHAALPRGRYYATITIESSEARVPTQVINVSFFVRDLSISLSMSGDYTLNGAGEYVFPSVNDNEPVTSQITVTVNNTGNDETGILYVSLAGSSPGSFALSTETITNIPLDGKIQFVVLPKWGLRVGTHTASVSVSGPYIMTKTFVIKFVVTSLRISLSADFSFGEMGVGYASPPTEHEFTITNKGDGAIDALTLGFLLNSNAFKLSRTSINEGIIEGGTATFSVRPLIDLMPGTYYETILVSNTDETVAAQVNVVFVVTFIRIALSDSQVIIMPAVEDYTSTRTATIRVYNMGTASTGTLAIKLESGDVGCFTLSKTSISGIAVEGNEVFTIKPTLGLKQGTYSVLVSVGNGAIQSQSVEVIFRVGGYGILLSTAGLYEFNFKQTGYNSERLNVFVTNIGNLATGPLHIGFKGEAASASAFSLSTKNLASINEKNGISMFDIETARGLNPGKYTVTVVVSGNKIASQSFDITFTVYGYGCPCGPQTPQGDYTPMYMIPALLGILFLLWLGMRKLAVPPVPAAQAKGKEDAELLNMFIMANNAATAAQASYVPPPPVDAQFSNPARTQGRQEREQKATPKTPSIADQLLAQAKATVIAKKSQPAGGVGPSATATQVPGERVEKTSGQHSGSYEASVPDQKAGSTAGPSTAQFPYSTESQDSYPQQ